MRKILLAASAALIAFSAPALAQGRGGGGGGDHGGGPPAGVGGGLGVGGGGGFGGPGRDLGGLPANIPNSDNANAHASGQVTGDVHAQTDIHASDRAHERTGASVDHSTNAATGAGIASRTYRVGQRVSTNSKFYTDISAIPSAAKAQIPSQYMTDAYRYIYQPNRIYVVSDSSNKVVSVVNLNP
jgi:hypothetical protein